MLLRRYRRQIERHTLTVGPPQVPISSPVAAVGRPQYRLSGAEVEMPIYLHCTDIAASVHASSLHAEATLHG